MPALRGYDYQAWQSVLTWIKLKDSEILLLEAAEDLDILFEDQVVTIQVKETARSRTLTLNTPDVIEAIAHFWEHRNNNPERRVLFHFISTSRRSREQGDPFNGECGLNVWDKCKRMEADLSKLRSFLSSNTRLPSTLRQFVGDSTDDELREEVIRRIQWETGADPKEDVQELIRAGLIAWGSEHHLLPDECVMVLPHLYFHVWDMLSHEGSRSLRRSDFAILFQNVTTQRESTAELRRLRTSERTLATLLSENPLLRDESPNLALLHPIVNLPSDTIGLPVFERFAKREQLIYELRQKLTHRGVVVLRGSIGMAKSTLASQLIAPDHSDWHRVDLRGLPPEAIRWRLLEAAALAVSGGSSTRVVIDDLNFDERPDIYVTALIGLIRASLSSGGCVILTTQGDVPIRIRLSFELTEADIFNVPVLTQPEIKEVSMNYGCPDAFLTNWSAIILANTGGHPLLEHAQIINLCSDGWLRPKPENFLESVAIEEVRLEIRKKLQEQLPDEARTLAYRLSILGAYFKRSHALHIARYPSQIKNAGEAFDLLLGPWIEKLSLDYYRLSDLLRGAANKVFSPDEVRQLHAIAAAAFSREATVTGSDLWGIIWHGIQGKHDEALFAACKASKNATEEDWPALSRELFALMLLGLQQGERLYPTNQFISLLLRQLQLRIAEEFGPELATHIAECWSSEIESLIDHEAPGLKLLMQFTLLIEMLKFPPKVRYPTGFTVTNLVRGFKFLQEAQATVSKKGRNTKAIKMLRELLSIRQANWTRYDHYIQLAVFQCRTEGDLQEFFEALTGSEEQGAQVIWDELKDNNYLAMRLIDGDWLHESKASVPNWTKCLETLDRAAELAVSHNAHSLVAAAGRAKAIVFQEYLNANDRAVRALQEAEARLGHKHLMLEEYQAKILSLEERDEDALKKWTALAPDLDADGNPARAFSYQSAAICASRLSLWNEAAFFSQKAETAVCEAGWTGPIATAFKADHAFALLIQGAHVDAIRLFIESIEEIDCVADGQSGHDTYRLREKLAYVLGWMARSISGDGQDSRPAFGFFSDTDRQLKVVPGTTIPIVDTIYLWYFLAEIERACDGGDSAFIRFETLASEVDILPIRISLAELSIRRSLRYRMLDGLIDQYVVLAAGLSEQRIMRQGSGIPITGSELLIPLLLAGLIKLARSGEIKSAPISKWAFDSRQHGLMDDRLRLWFDCVQKSVDMAEEDLIHMMRDTDASMDSRVLAALLLCSDESLDPENRFYSDVTLVALDLYGLWSRDVEVDIAEFVSTGWRRVMDVCRFALLSPNATVPGIVRACSEDAQGFRKAARILLAARMAVSQKVDTSIRSRLKALAEAN